MAFVNGFTTISNVGTWLEFFSKVKESILERTDFELIEDTDYSFTLDTKRESVTIKVTDNVITSSSITSASNVLKLQYYQNGVLIGTDSCTYAQSTCTQTTTTTRTVNMATFRVYNDGGLLLSSYNQTNPSWTGNGLMIFKSHRLQSDDTIYRVKTSGGNSYSLDDSMLYVQNRFSSVSCPQIVLHNLLLNSSSSTMSGTIKEYAENIYNCVNVTPYRNYLINDKQYYAIDNNLLIEV